MSARSTRPKAHYPFAIITEWRGRVGISQAKLGQLLGISKDHVSKLETGNREFTLSMQLACERLSVQIAAEMQNIGLLLPNVFGDCLTCGFLGVEMEKEDKK